MLGCRSGFPVSLKRKDFRLKKAGTTQTHSVSFPSFTVMSTCEASGKARLLHTSSLKPISLQQAVLSRAGNVKLVMSDGLEKA